MSNTPKVQCKIELDADMHKSLKLFCVSTEQLMKDFVKRAIVELFEKEVIPANKARKTGCASHGR